MTFFMLNIKFERLFAFSFQLEQKLVASEIFKDKKDNYPQSVAKLFVGTRLSKCFSMLIYLLLQMINCFQLIPVVLVSKEGLFLFHFTFLRMGIITARCILSFYRNIFLLITSICYLNYMLQEITIVISVHLCEFPKNKVT